ncbi:phosphate ABC transporter membrane protein 2, PhoT family [Longilinea arvoryzae]|uniref:Phosphate transport system permease protein PstA n=1 Tax=Longilinea arvoryzae TaxID=360412 RepID=A0A0S7BBP3_9CHLR|nr:phosphate ABC transporter permease PstA [Longilinea arvoryzae]GAP15247.1 phosphate ABC transporter membrane protein 2, PhoT family [Longilinea arvoryzae]
MNHDFFIEPSHSRRSSGLAKRHRTGKVWQGIFFSATVIGLIALIALLLTVLDKSFSYVVIEYKKDPATLASKPLAELTNSDLANLLEANLSKNRFRTLDRAQTITERNHADLLNLVYENVVQPRALDSFSITQWLMHSDQIRAEVTQKYPKGHLEFRAWFSGSFLIDPLSGDPLLTGVRAALLGSLYLILITVLVAFPIGVGSAIYLEEYADSKKWYNRIIQTNIDNLAGVPSIVYGILGLAIFVRGLAPLTSGAVFGSSDSNGRTILSAGLTMALLILPVIIINAQEAIRAVPVSLRQASYGLGATRWQTIWNHVLPAALPGILTGTILAISRAMGETAPLIIVGAAAFITSDPTGPFSKFTALPIQIYNWTTRPQEVYRNVAAAAILVLMISLLSLNAAAILLRNRFSRRLA